MDHRSSGAFHLLTRIQGNRLQVSNTRRNHQQQIDRTENEREKQEKDGNGDGDERSCSES